MSIDRYLERRSANSVDRFLAKVRDISSPDRQDTEGLALAGRIEPNPLGRDDAGESVERSASRSGRRVRRAPDPDGPSWRAEDER